ncbi:uncharacterized protein mettl21ca isoform X1 [Misgurnus anguillicaudatus]|uniref:uncharacterized protein mettl21ca isoform X1 n=2 Tax=Misgurnus anguillicaudatus TaxID=75329 RepID=UPI003CCFA51A
MSRFLSMDRERCKRSAVQTLKTQDKVKQEEAEVLYNKSVYTPSEMSSIGKEMYYFAGHEIKIWESLDSFGSVIWPAALALCRYLESNRETVNLRDKAVLEIGAGTGLVSIVASLLGAWVTATDLPEVLANLRCNLSRNTTGRCRYTPQAAELVWGHELERTFPHSVYRYDYVLAADVVYLHDFLAELMLTMKHFCKPGTTLIWANKTRFQSDLVFAENFKKTFNTKLLEDNGEIKIYSATIKEENVETIEKQTAEMINITESNHSREIKQESKTDGVEIQKLPIDQTTVKEMQEVERNEEDEKTDERHREENLNLTDDEETKRNSTENDKQQTHLRLWVPTVYFIPGKEIHYFLGQKIKILESIDSYGATIWPAAVTLCRFLETAEGQQQINLCDKSVLELGAGTGLLSVVITLLGAKLTATDLPEILSNLTSNLNWNTRGHRRHEPLVTQLFWGHKLEETFPRSTHHYDYVIATDVVYHHDYLTELLITMRHFCQPGTTLVWANKIRYATDLGFLDNFQKCFNSRLLVEMDDVRIYVATSRETEEEKNME